MCVCVCFPPWGTGKWALLKSHLCSYCSEQGKKWCPEKQWVKQSLCFSLRLSVLPWISSRELERGCLGPTQESHEFGNGLLWIPFPSGFSGVRQTELRFAKLILALRHHPWINKSNERTKIVNHFTAFPFKMVSSAWTFLAANTILWVISTTDNPDLPQKLRNRGILISGLPLAQLPKSLPAMQETWVQSLGQEDPLEKEMTAHSRILGWESHGQRSLVATVHGVTKSWTWLSD